MIRIGHDRQYVHRLSYCYYYGDFDETLCVCHRCDTPSCINPEHLFLDTKSGNSADASAKHRMGSLSEQDIEFIRYYLSQGLSNKVIANRMKIDSSVVSKIKTGKLYKYS